MKVKQIHSMTEIDASDWNRVVGSSYPFIRHEFLLALEKSASASEHSGWQAQHLLVYDTDSLLAVMPLYKKNHSRGEYVFDHQWYHAYNQYGLEYYPKWVTSIPFTPCQDRRIFCKNGVTEKQVVGQIIDFLTDHADSQQISSWHCLFPNTEQAQLLESFGLLLRTDIQFQWRNQNYQQFDDFLAVLNSKYRKKIKRERRRIAEQGINLQQFSGMEMNEALLKTFVHFYEMTYLKNGMPAYLNVDFFQRIVATMPEQLLFVFAFHNSVPVGAALSFIGEKTLYGRYWGCFDEYHSLHFETCYYQGIEFCIRNKLQTFDSGAQGEHKIARGFEPITTYSAHWIKNAQFAKAIANFLNNEKALIENYKDHTENFLPFKKE